MTRFVSEKLGAHDRSGFTSGHERIDRCFRETVSQDVKRGYAACHVLVERRTGRLAGFHTLSARSVALSDLPPSLSAKLPRYPSVPVVLIGCMGRSLAFRGEGVGSLLLIDAISRVVQAPLGVHAICADAIDETAAEFYRAHQFQRLESRPGMWFLPMKVAVALMGE